VAREGFPPQQQHEHAEEVPETDTATDPVPDPRVNPKGDEGAFILLFGILSERALNEGKVSEKCKSSCC
jgi:hypothetical protein